MKDSSRQFLQKIPIIFFSFVYLFFAVETFAQPSGYEKMDVPRWNVYASKEFNESDIRTAVVKALNENLNQVSSNTSNASLSVLRMIPICIELNLKEKYLYPIDYHPSAKWLKEHGLNPQWARCLVIANAYEFLALNDSKSGCLLSSLADGYNDRKFQYNLQGMKSVGEKLKKNQKMIAFLNGDIVTYSDSIDHRRLFNNLSVIYLAPKGGNSFTRDDLKAFDEDAYLYMKKVWEP